jgi:transketolase
VKFASFGWHVERVDGHDFGAMAAQLERLQAIAAPKLLIADTIKGRGVSFMEHTALPSDKALYGYHSGAPDTDRKSDEVLAHHGLDAASLCSQIAFAFARDRA